jgi:putative component of membrane protein insertase Oxa1/YidC/SpoIIIJ protein YidD
MDGTFGSDIWNKEITQTFRFKMWGVSPQWIPDCRCYALLLTRTVNTQLELYEAYGQLVKCRPALVDGYMMTSRRLKLKLKLKLICDLWPVGQCVLVSGSCLEPMTRSLFSVWQLWVSWCSAPSLTRGWACNLLVQLRLGHARAVTLGSKFRRTRDYILLSHLRLPQPRGPGSHIYIPREQGGPVIPPFLIGWVELSWVGFDRRSVGLSVLVSGTPLGPMTRFYFFHFIFPENCLFRFVSSLYNLEADQKLGTGCDSCCIVRRYGWAVNTTLPGYQSS